MSSATGSEPPSTRIAVTQKRTREELSDAIAWLDAAEQATGIPLVDEGERQRLRRLEDSGERAPGWWSAVAERDGEVVGYAGVVAPDEAARDAPATGDVAVGGRHWADDDAVAIRSALLGAVVDHLDAAAGGRSDSADVSGADAPPASVQIWMRDVAEAHLAGLGDDGFVVARRLGILGRDLTRDVEVPELADVAVRSFEHGTDDDAVIEVLALAYEGTGDGGWTPERFAERRNLPWFRAEDLLLAEELDSGRILGLHWLKRRGEGVGEVYNLAIHPDGQGRGVGGLLLSAGLAHLKEVGCHDVLLWVDRANQRAVELYTSRGFTTRWDDVALESVP